MSRRRMFSVTPSGLVPASNRNLCSCPALVTVTSTENPCSAISASGTRPPAIIASGRRGLRAEVEPPGRSLVGHQVVGDVVHQGDHGHRVHRLQVDLDGRLHVVPYRGGQAGRAVIHAHGTIVGERDAARMSWTGRAARRSNPTIRTRLRRALGVALKARDASAGVGASVGHERDRQRGGGRPAVGPGRPGPAALISPGRWPAWAPVRRSGTSSPRPTSPRSSGRGRRARGRGQPVRARRTTAEEARYCGVAPGPCWLPWMTAGRHE